ncbi:MAG: hypothetical protein SV375_14885 [Thermodesulfobacteriota bacterium]|nr:hypothetical protein [Thermodesulfobacteriota bacterium]
MGSNRELLELQLNKLIYEVEKETKNQAINVYTRIAVDTDFKIHLFQDSKTVENSGSRLGLCLASALKEFGLVNHSIWIEMHKE